MRSIAIAVASMLLLLAIPLQAQTLTDAQKAEIEKVLTENHREILSFGDKLSTAGYEKYLSDSFQVRAGSGSIQAESKDAFLKWLAGIFSQRASQTNSPYKINVYVLSQEFAYSLVINGAQITLKNGRKGGYGNAHTFIWKKEPGGWKVVHIHESTW